MIIHFFMKPYRWAILFSILLLSACIFTLLDAFVIPKALMQVSESVNSSQTLQTEITEELAPDPLISGTSYQDENIKINIETVRNDDTTFYVAEITLSGIEYLKTALANDIFGRNIKESTSVMAENNQAIFAVNGDYYGFRDTGFVVRNAVLYRDTSSGRKALVIDDQGNFSIVDENTIGSQAYLNDNVWQVFSFGPVLIENGAITVDTNSEVEKSMRSNPRTAIGQIGPLHYIVIVSDGRTDESEGLSLLELAQEFKKRGAETAYNLDGGGSSTMWFLGEIINSPTTSGRQIKEREISDIIYIGYE